MKPATVTSIYAIIAFALPSPTSVAAAGAPAPLSNSAAATAAEEPWMRTAVVPHVPAQPSPTPAVLQKGETLVVAAEVCSLTSVS